MIFKLKYGEDIYEAITRKCIDKKIKCGMVFFIGAVQKATLGYYNQKTKKYKKIKINRPCEITSGVGNISIRDGKPFMHAHISLSDKDGKMFGGHLFSPTTVFVCETYIAKENQRFVRGFDSQTGLFLWKK